MRLVNVLRGGAVAVAVTGATLLATPVTANAMPIDRCSMYTQEIQTDYALANYWSGLADVYLNQGLYSAWSDALSTAGWYDDSARIERADARADGC